VATLIILAAQETEIRRITVRSQPWKIVHKTLFEKKNPSQKRPARVAQGVDPTFKPQYSKKEFISNPHSFIYFSCLILLATNFTMILKHCVGNRHSCLLPGLREKALLLSLVGIILLLAFL
jgi:hypothetical protein